VVFAQACITFSPDHSAQNTNRDIKITKAWKRKISIPFELINNLVVVPLRINDSDTLHFVLDTGVGRMLITELPEDKELAIKYTRNVKLSGLGDDEPVVALFSSGNTIVMDGVAGDSLDVVVMLEDVFNLSSFMGREINGLIGYDIFKNFIVEINYTHKKLYFHDPDLYAEKYAKKKRSRRWTKIDIEIENRKPYLNTWFVQKDSTIIQANLLIDSGASHAIALYPSSNDSIFIPAKRLYSYLGTGLSGDIYGEIGRAERMGFGEITIENPVVYYPEEEGIHRAILENNRNGSIGSDLLKRFKLFINYEDSTILVKPNNKFKQDFNYNMAGIEVGTPIPNLPIYVVSRVRKGSPADIAGILVDDIITEINFKKAHLLDLGQIYENFQDQDGKKITMVIRRNDDETRKFVFRLKDKTR